MDGEPVDYFALISSQDEQRFITRDVPCWCKAKGMEFGRELNPEDTTEVREGHPCCGSCHDWADFYIDLERREHATRLIGAGFNGA